MHALLRKKQEWESYHEQQLLRLVETSANVSVDSVKKAGLLTSFLLYVMYKTLRIVLALAALLLKGPKLRRYTSPTQAPEAWEGSEVHVEALHNPRFRI